MEQLQCTSTLAKQTATYSEANELVFGQNLGQQWVRMSLCSLIYNYKEEIKILLMISS